jgi:hypothetical protein
MSHSSNFLNGEFDTNSKCFCDISYMRLKKPDIDICSTFVEYMTDYKYHNDYNRAEEMLRLSIKQETSLTFSILVIALASLFASGPILGNQQASAAGGGGFGGGGGGGGFGGGAAGGGSFASSGASEVLSVSTISTAFNCNSTSISPIRDVANSLQKTS